MLAGDQLIILDAGSGIRELGNLLLKQVKGEPIKGHILISHTHWDHIQGFPFFAPAYLKGNEFTIYGSEGARKRLKDIWADQMRSEYFPVPLELMASKLDFWELSDGQKFQIGNVEVTTKTMNHPGLCFAYRLFHEGKTLVYATDNEPYRWTLDSSARTEEQKATNRALIEQMDTAFVQFAEGADLLIHDAQYTVKEYKTHIGWGHSFLDFVVEIAREAHVKNLALFHHDPLHTDRQIDQMVQYCRQLIKKEKMKLKCSGAKEGMKVTL
jgi:phosphoribosyl 1,2-cyclic phosphodiesterase